MSNFKDTIRRETGLVEHFDQHGCGHPCYASADWLALMEADAGQGSRVANREAYLVHGCTGACRDKDWQIESLTNSIHMAHDWLLRRIKVIRAGVETIAKLRERINRLEEELKKNGLSVPQ